MIKIAKLSLSSKVYLATLPVILTATAVSIAIFYFLSMNYTGLKEALLIKSSAREALSHLLAQDDATKAMLIDTERMMDYSEVKIDSFDRHMEVLDQIAEKNIPDTIAATLKKLKQLDEQTLRPIDQAILEAAFEDMQRAREKYFSEYEPKRKEYEGLINRMIQQAIDHAEIQESSMKEYNLYSTGLIVAFLLAGMGLSLVLIVTVISRISKLLQGEMILLNQQSEEIAQVSAQMKTKAVNAAESVEEQSGSIIKCLNAAERAEQSIHSVEEKTKIAADAGSEVRRITESGQEIVTKISQSFHRLGEAFQEIQQTSATLDQEANSELKALYKAVSNVCDITTAIREIVASTKILSFNASIEAARAGRYGKGFAVVAQEVGNLALQSDKQALAIEQLVKKSLEQLDQTISTIHNSVGETAKSVSQSMEAVSSVGHCTTELTSNFNHIITNIQDLVDRIVEIQNSTSDQTQMTEQVTKEAENLKNHSEVAKQDVAENQMFSESLQNRVVAITQMSATVRTRIEGKPTQTGNTQDKNDAHKKAA